MPRIKKPGGFTLIEILIALTVFAITASALISGLTRHVSQAALLRDKIIAHWVAENEISQIRNPASELSHRSRNRAGSKGGSKLNEVRHFPSIGTNYKEVTMGDMEWQVRISVSATQNKDIRRVSVDVYPAGTDNDDISLVTLDGFAGRF
ncbi:MAG: type II secretion system minor pseudopilin GspI [Gammaproteobacteria bacterium]|nr:type II secretion system minor pseudopilin GspI [Gammaproteobacteria bacterium]